MTSRLRFITAHQVFEAFPAASEDIAAKPGEGAPPIDFLRELLNSPRPGDAIAFCAYLLPRREAVWWAAQCVRALQDGKGDDSAIQAAEAWVREPEEAIRRKALDIAGAADKGSATTWLAMGAGWSGGNMLEPGMPAIMAPPHLTAKAVKTAIFLALARSTAGDQESLILACVEAGIRFAEGGDAKPRLTASRPTPAKPVYFPPALDQR